MTDQELESLAAQRYAESVRTACLSSAISITRPDDREYLATVLTRALAFYAFISNTPPPARVLH